MKRVLKLAILTILLFISPKVYASAGIVYIKHEIINNTLETEFRLTGAANEELISLIFSNKSVIIKYRIDIIQKRSIFKRDNVAWGTINIISDIKYDAFSRVFTVNYDFQGEKSRKRIVRSSDLRQSVKLIVMHFFNKSWLTKIPLTSLNRGENNYSLRIKISVESIKLAPPYNIINSSFNFIIEELKDIR
jgi:hypothetical protein